MIARFELAHSLLFDFSPDYFFRSYVHAPLVGGCTYAPEGLTSVFAPAQKTSGLPLMITTSSSRFGQHIR